MYEICADRLRKNIAQPCYREVLLNGGCINVDSKAEFDYIKLIAGDNPDKEINILKGFFGN